MSLGELIAVMICEIDAQDTGRVILCADETLEGLQTKPFKKLEIHKKLQICSLAMAYKTKCFTMKYNHPSSKQHLTIFLKASNSRNFCAASTMFQTNSNQSDKEYNSSKMTELYRKHVQYRDVITRTSGDSQVYNRLDETRKIYECKHISDLKSLYQSMHTSHDHLIPIFDVYIAFQKRSLDLDKTQSFHSEIFHDLKTKLLKKDCIGGKTEVLIGKLFNNAMLAAVSSSENTKIGITKMFEIYEEYKTLCNDDSNSWRRDLPYFPITLTRIISTCTMTGSFGRAKDVIEDLFNAHPQTFDYNKKHQQKLWNSILNFYAKTKDLQSMEKYFQLMTVEYKIKPDDVTFNIRMNAFAKEKDMRFETVFKEYIEQFNRYPGQNVFAALLSGYSMCGDITSCIEVLKLLLSKNDADVRWDSMSKTLPNLNFLIFVPVFKCLINSQVHIQSEYGWKLVDYLLTQMEAAKVEPNEIIYGIIFTLCGDAFFDAPSMEKLRFYYSEMTDKWNLRPQHTQLKNILKAGLQYYDDLAGDCEDEEGKNEITRQKFGFVEWWKEEMNKYDVTLNNELKHMLISARCINCL